VDNQVYSSLFDSKTDEYSV